MLFDCSAELESRVASIGNRNKRQDLSAVAFEKQRRQIRVSEISGGRNGVARSSRSVSLFVCD